MAEACDVAVGVVVGFGVAAGPGVGFAVVGFVVVVGAAGVVDPLRGITEGAGVFGADAAHFGSSELWANSRIWAIASSRLPAGSPALTWARPGGRRS